MADEEPTNTAPTPDASSSFGQLGQQLRTAIQDTCQQLGLSPEMAERLQGMLQGMFGGNMQVIETVMNVMQNLGANGVQGVGGEIADGSQVAPPTVTGPAQELGTPRLG